MECRKKRKQHCATSPLCGAHDSLSPPTIDIASLFRPPLTTVVDRNSCSELMGSMQKRSSLNQMLSSMQGTPVDRSGIFDEERSPIFQERVEPCSLSSSLYYGGLEDMYIKTPSDYALGSYPNFKKDFGEDDLNGNHPDSASRGNWWQGSLYY